MSRDCKNGGADLAPMGCGAGEFSRTLIAEYDDRDAVSNEPGLCVPVADPLMVAGGDFPNLEAVLVRRLCLPRGVRCLGVAG